MESAEVHESRGRSGGFCSSLFLPFPAHHGVIIHHAHGLHERVANRRTHELKAAPLQVFAQGIALRGFHGKVF